MKIIAISYLKRVNLLDDKSCFISYIPFNQISRFDLIDNNMVEVVLNDKTNLILNGLYKKDELEALIIHIHKSKETIIYVDKFIEEYNNSTEISDSEEDRSDDD